jgi:hypothetical protein
VHTENTHRAQTTSYRTKPNTFSPSIKAICLKPPGMCSTSRHGVSASMASAVSIRRCKSRVEFRVLAKMRLVESARADQEIIVARNLVCVVARFLANGCVWSIL